MLRKQSLLTIDYFSQPLKMTIFVGMKKEINKKAFQSSANRPLADSTGCMVRGGVLLYGEVQAEHTSHTLVWLMADTPLLQYLVGSADLVV